MNTSSLLESTQNLITFAENGMRSLGEYIQENPKVALGVTAGYLAYKHSKKAIVLAGLGIGAYFYQDQIAAVVADFAKTQTGHAFAQTTVGQLLDQYVVEWIPQAYVGGSFNPLNWIG